jgi:hypothetical protein
VSEIERCECGMPHLTAIEFLDKPDDYPALPRSASRMVSPPPERLRVALHLQALGVYDILGPTETRQESLWRTVEYERVEEGVPNAPRLPALYRVARSSVPELVERSRALGPVMEAQGERVAHEEHPS